MRGLVAWLAALSIILAACGQASVPRATSGGFFWDTKARPRSLIDLDEIRPGGPPPDGIPPIDKPKFVTAASAARWLRPNEPVIVLIRTGDVRAYPLQIMTWHEIVNDDGVTVTFCPLCNSAIAFERTVDGRVLDFGASGRLYRSNLVMYDRQTKSLWLQFTGQAVVGPFIGKHLAQVPVQIVSWGQVRREHPQVKVLSRDTGHDRDYGRNPYAGYDDVDASPFLFDGPTDGRLRPMERIVAVDSAAGPVAYRYDDLRRVGVVNDGELVVLFQDGTSSALDSSAIAEGRDVGATGVFQAGDVRLQRRDGRFADAKTGSVWSVLGEAIDGPLRGSRLTPVEHIDTFWFVWAAFRPSTRIWIPAARE